MQQINATLAGQQEALKHVIGNTTDQMIDKHNENLKILQSSVATLSNSLHELNGTFQEKSYSTEEAIKMITATLQNHESLLHSPLSSADMQLIYN